MRSKEISWRYSLATTLLLLSPFDLLASLGMDMYLPVVPLMATALGAGAGTIQLTLTMYLVLLGAGQLVFGPLSDRFGRRPVLFGGGIAYACASFCLAAASSPEMFLFARIVQACGASACLVSTFATVRDIYSGREEGNVIYGLLGAMLALVPALGPMLGTWVDAWLGWRAIFGLLGLTMLGALAIAWWRWPETRRPSASGLCWSQRWLPLKRRHFWLYTLCYSAGMGSFFVFFSTAPWLMMGRQGLSRFGFSLWFASVAIVMMATSRAMATLIPRWGSLKMLRTGMGCLMAGALLLALGEMLMPRSVAGFILPMWIIGIGIAIAVAVAPNGALRGFDAMAGAATALYFCVGGLLLGSLGTFAMALLPRFTAWPIIAYCLILAAGVLSLLRFGHHESGPEAGSSKLGANRDMDR